MAPGNWGKSLNHAPFQGEKRGESIQRKGEGLLFLRPFLKVDVEPFFLENL